MKTSEKLKIIQLFSGLTQEKLAKKLGVSFVSLNNWANDKAKPYTKNQRKINHLYLKTTNQKEVIENSLKAKKQIIFQKTKKYKSILKRVMKNRDIYDQLLLSLVYNTNKIEDSTLTEEETRTILFDDAALSNRSMTEQLKVKNHQAAWRYLLKRLARNKVNIDQKLILKLHGTLFNGIRDDAGFYKGQAMGIASNYVPTDDDKKIPKSMGKLVKEINTPKKDVISQVAKTHSRFEKIHPFSDGSEKIAMLIMQAMLLRDNLPPAIVQQDKKRLYMKYLKNSQSKKDYLPLEEFLCEAMFEGLKILERKIK